MISLAVTVIVAVISWVVSGRRAISKVDISSLLADMSKGDLAAHLTEVLSLLREFQKAEADTAALLAGLTHPVAAPPVTPAPKV